MSGYDEELFKEYADSLFINHEVPKPKNKRLWQFGIYIIYNLNKRHNKDSKIKKWILNIQSMMDLYGTPKLFEDWEHLKLYTSINICSKCEKYATYNFPKWKGWGLFCREHKETQMVDIKSPKIKYQLVLNKPPNINKIYSYDIPQIKLSNCLISCKSVNGYMIDPEKIHWKVITI